MKNRPVKFGFTKLRFCLAKEFLDKYCQDKWEPNIV